jgi:flagellar capping protein FliD
MDNVSGGMKSLCEDIATSHGDRKRNIKDLREQAEAIRDNARKFVGHCRKVHMEMAEGLTKGLKEDRKELIKNVSSLREDFRKKEKEIRADLTEASKIWNKMNKTLETKKRGGKNDR